MKIEAIHSVVTFNVDYEILFTLGEAIKGIQKTNKAQVQTLNTPSGTRPEAPRVVILSSNFIINIALNRIETVFVIPNQINSEPKKVLKYCNQLMEYIAEALINKYVEYDWAGLITTLHYPLKNKKRSLEQAVPLFDRLLTIDRKNQQLLASFALQYGFEESNHFRNYTISAYESIAFSIQTETNTPVVIDLSSKDNTVDESGIEIKIDINNRPQDEKKEFFSDFSRIIESMESSIDTVLEETGLKGVVYG